MITRSITIYSHTAHIKELYAAGTNEIMLPKSAELQSIMIVTVKGNILPFNYIDAAAIALTNRHNGEQITAIVKKNNDIVTGEVLSYDSDSITILLDETAVTIRHYDKIEFTNLAGNTRPYLIVAASTQNFTVSYLLSTIGWQCIGTALYDNTRDIIVLRLAADVTNNTELDLIGELTVVSGDVQQQRRQASRTMVANNNMLMARPSMSSETTENKIQDYHKYNVGARTLYNNNILELGVWEIPALKIYVHYISSFNIVEYGFRATSSEYIPAATVNVYEIQNGSIGSYLGSDIIDIVPVNKQFDIMVGATSAVLCESTLTTVDKEIESKTGTTTTTTTEITKHNVTDTLRVNITNTTPQQLWLVIKHFIGNRKFVSSTQNVDRLKDGYLEWYVNTNPSQQGQWNCVVQTTY